MWFFSKSTVVTRTVRVCDIHIEYGAEDGRSNPFDMGRVEIPWISISLSSAQEQMLVAQFNPLANSECSGFDHYINVYSFLRNE